MIFSDICARIEFVHRKKEIPKKYTFWETKLEVEQRKFAMPPETICKIVRQYNKFPISKEDMEKLKEIAEDYGKVKNYVYQRYSGMKSLPKLYPGYTIQNEMTRCGMREGLQMPSVYFYLAVFDAIGAIKSRWTKTKGEILKAIRQNEGFTEEEQHFLRYVLKVNNAFEAALNGSLLKLPKEVHRQYDFLAGQVDVHKMENYLRRQVRRYHHPPHAGKPDGFSITAKAYRYGDEGIYISVKEKRKRIFIPLTDHNTYTRQLFVRLYPEERNVELQIPVDRAVKKHEDYNRHVGISIGMLTMVVTDEGHCYGEEFGEYQTRLSDWIRKQSVIYSQNREANPGRKKYDAAKKRLEEQLHSYINQELNRFLREEKPGKVFIPKLPKPMGAGKGKRINHYAAMWQRGYIRERLMIKCREQSVEVREVFGKDISNQCSSCGSLGRKKDSRFVCSKCGYEADVKQNAAQNAKNRGENIETFPDYKNLRLRKFPDDEK